MPINTLEYAKIFQTALDEQMIAEASSGWMEGNASQVKYTGGNEIKIPKISMNGLGDYDRDEGFTQGSVSLAFQTLTMTQDRGRTFQLDAMDVDETNFVANATNVMAQFQRTQVVPEVDAYRYSKIFALAEAAGKVNGTAYTPIESDILKKLKTDISNVQDIVGEGYELVITMSIPCATVLEQSDKISKQLNVADFTKGSITTKVMSLDNIPIIKVRSNLMKSAYVFNDGITAGQKAGGFVVDSGAKQINWLITARKSPIAVSKTDTMRIFDPMTNQKANAWKLDYRKYHDLWIPDNAKDGIWANAGN